MGGGTENGRRPDMLGNDFFTTLHFPLTTLTAFIGNLFQGIDIEEVNTVEIVDGGIDIAGHGDVDDKKWATVAAAAQGGMKIPGMHDGVGRGRAADENVHGVDLLLPIIEGQGTALHFGSEFHGTIVVAIGNDDAGGEI